MINGRGNKILVIPLIISCNKTGYSAPGIKITSYEEEIHTLVQKDGVRRNSDSSLNVSISTTTVYFHSPTEEGVGEERWR